ncbi:MAG: class I SAM-dependent methyltransferase [Candidatus Aenigmatarchaeota archaeon]|nr:MAG: class I SAM-dependent methyltransferase [Candidatus Aenigmarchaeota archaeon]
MFFSKIYKSWEGIQEEKYKRILLGFDTDLLAKAFSGRVLDMGSGSGFFEKFLEEQGFNLSKWICLDPDSDMLKESGFQNMLGDGNRLPFKSKSFDCIVCLDSIHLIREDFFWVLKPEGFTLVSLFYNPGNLKEKRRFLKERMKNMETVKEFQIEGRENEIFILARKR